MFAQLSNSNEYSYEDVSYSWIGEASKTITFVKDGNVVGRKHYASHGHSPLSLVWTEAGVGVISYYQNILMRKNKTISLPPYIKTQQKLVLVFR
jgi:hypothetical protein